jgi:hypothetical protein
MCKLILKMKVGFLVNIMLLLCFICSQLLIWLIDGTLVNTLAQLLNVQASVFSRDSIAQTRRSNNYMLSCYGDECHQ